MVEATAKTQLQNFQVAVTDLAMGLGHTGHK